MVMLKTPYLYSPSINSIPYEAGTSGSLVLRGAGAACDVRPRRALRGPVSIFLTFLKITKPHSIIFLGGLASPSWGKLAGTPASLLHVFCEHVPSH